MIINNNSANLHYFNSYRKNLIRKVRCSTAAEYSLCKSNISSILSLKLLRLHKQQRTNNTRHTAAQLQIYSLYLLKSTSTKKLLQIKFHNSSLFITWNTESTLRLFNTEASWFHADCHSEIFLNLCFRLVDGHINSVETCMSTREHLYILVTM